MLRPVALALVHHPVLDRRGDVVTAAVTNLDIHDLARLATTYRLSRYYLVTPTEEQQRLTARIVEHWQEGFGARYNPDRRQALDCLQIVPSLDAAMQEWRELNGQDGVAVLTGARHQSGLDFPAARALAAQQPVMLVFGTGHGLAPDLYTPDRPCLVPVRAGHYNHLSVRTAAAIILDRLIGETGHVSPLPAEGLNP
jgi:hypothetical protein